MDMYMSNLYIIGAFVARALAIVDPDGKSPTTFSELTFVMHNLFLIFFHFFLISSFDNNLF